MFKGKVSSTHHATDAMWTKWIALITQWARMGNLDSQEILEVITDWSEEPVVHDCLETIEAVYSSRPDLKEQPLKDAEDSWFTDESSFVKQGVHKAGSRVQGRIMPKSKELVSSSSSASDSDSEVDKKAKRKKQAAPEKPVKKQKTGESSKGAASSKQSGNRDENMFQALAEGDYDANMQVSCSENVFSNFTRVKESEL
ncbi:hypothetical protein AV530_019721 [Patagioenas fasciata monilis]|uniref:Uncharacterized protein n=1 Tax=Patagioenas fasciata monilis TaxID=372326 RepID=A0A1V4JH17_PATFA|nr:hypothetical protein AV530_019721 [Patagioenas fasciata monilis]